MTRTLPEHLRVHYQYHDRPRGTSAVIQHRLGGGVVAVGFAKFNPADGSFDAELGKRIALGRALAEMDRREHGRICNVKLREESLKAPHHLKRRGRAPSCMPEGSVPPKAPRSNFEQD